MLLKGPNDVRKPLALPVLIIYYVGGSQEESKMIKRKMQFD